MHRIADAVASAEGADPARTKAALLQRIAVLIARATAKAVQRRDVQHTASPIHSSSAMQILTDAEGDANEDDVNEDDATASAPNLCSRLAFS